MESTGGNWSTSWLSSSHAQASHEESKLKGCHDRWIWTASLCLPSTLLGGLRKGPESVA